MDRQPTEQPSGAGIPPRPAALANATATQVMALERQYNDGDRRAFDEHVASYGWSPADADAIWSWFSSRPTAEGQSRPSGTAI